MRGTLRVADWHDAAQGALFFDRDSPGPRDGRVPQEAAGG